VRTVVCLGNALRGDDGAGPEVARRLREHRIAALAETPESLLSGWDRGEDVVVVDSVRSGAPPGTVHRIDARREPLPAGMTSGSTHLLGLADAVELARVTDRLPRTLEIIGIEGATFELGAGLTPAVELAVERVVRELAM
jgi:hydrogenase maturation protease